jgi:hypothetical protein
MLRKEWMQWQIRRFLRYPFLLQPLVTSLSHFLMFLLKYRFLLLKFRQHRPGQFNLLDTSFIRTAQICETNIIDADVTSWNLSGGKRGEGGVVSRPQGT